MRHCDILPEQCCPGELIPQQESTPYLQVFICPLFGTEFRWAPDSDWVTVIYTEMRNPS